MEKDVISEGLAKNDLVGSCQITVNDAGTCADGGTNLTRPDSPNVHGSTYFVRVGDAIKIGAATNFKTRLQSLQTGQVELIEVLAVVPASLIDEFKTQQLFAHLRIRGEWFRNDAELLYFIEQAKAEAAAEPVPEPSPRSARSTPINPALSQHEAIRRLINARAKVYGADTPEGHTCSNLAEMLKNMETYVRPDWAKDERQTLPWMIKQQMKRLAPRAV